MNISIVNLSKYFVAKNLITIEDEEEILCASRDRARLFLSKIEASLKAGFTNGFNIMLDIMLQHGNVTDIQLAEQMKSEIKDCKNSKCICVLYICMYVCSYTVSIKKFQLKHSHLLYDITTAW